LHTLAEATAAEADVGAVMRWLDPTMAPPPTTRWRTLGA